MNGGWIKIHRQLQEHWLWGENTQRLKWWLDILINANYEPKEIFIGRQKVFCGRGQSVRSLENWAQRWRTTKSTVTAFFKVLEGSGMIKTENMRITTRITVCNYDTYQDDANGDDAANSSSDETDVIPQVVPKTERKQNEYDTANDTQRKKERNKEIKKERNNSKGEVLFVPPLLEDVKAYFEEKGYSESAAIKAWEYYETGNWKDSKGNKVKNWKQKMLSVWFKPENLKPQAAPQTTGILNTPVKRPMVY